MWRISPGFLGSSLLCPWLCTTAVLLPPRHNRGTSAFKLCFARKVGRLASKRHKWHLERVTGSTLQAWTKGPYETIAALPNGLSSPKILRCHKGWDTVGQLWFDLNHGGFLPDNMARSFPALSPRVRCATKCYLCCFPPRYLTYTPGNASKSAHLRRRSSLDRHTQPVSTPSL